MGLLVMFHHVNTDSGCLAGQALETTVYDREIVESAKFLLHSANLLVTQKVFSASLTVKARRALLVSARRNRRARPLSSLSRTYSRAASLPDSESKERCKELMMISISP